MSLGKKSRKNSPPRKEKVAGVNTTEGSKKKKERNVRKFETYIFRIFKECSGGAMTMKAQCANVLNSLVNDLIERIGFEASQLCKYNGSSVIRPRDLQSAVSLALGYNETSRITIQGGFEALEKWKTSFENES